jgi:hypothetical protein
VPAAVPGVAAFPALADLCGTKGGKPLPAIHPDSAGEVDAAVYYAGTCSLASS